MDQTSYQLEQQEVKELNGDQQASCQQCGARDEEEVASELVSILVVVRGNAFILFVGCRVMRVVALVRSR